MGRRERFKKRNKPEHIAVDIEPKKTNRFAKFWNGISRTGKVLGGISLLIGIITGIIKIKDAFYPPVQKPIIEKTAREKFDQDYIDSSLNPPKIYNEPNFSILEHPPVFTTAAKYDSSPTIKGIKLLGDASLLYVIFNLGTTLEMIPIQSLDSGVRLRIPALYKGCNPSYISFVIKDNRLYVSAEFKDLLKEETIGIIEYNHWRLYKSNLFDFHNTDDKLEVIDKQNNIVFSIKFEIGPANFNSVNISGYFINPYSIAILSYKDPIYLKSGQIIRGGLDTCIDKATDNWKQKSAVLISDIKTIFPSTP
jgi:hypothetical protein